MFIDYFVLKSNFGYKNFIRYKYKLTKAENSIENHP
jgi:hypothetical protein